MVRVLILAGGREPYVDPWHPFAEVADRLAALALRAGHLVELRHDPAERIAEGLGAVDVLVTNAPSPEVGSGLDPALAAAAHGALEEFAERDAGVLGLHVGLTALAGWPRWSALMGARWTSASGHPPLGDATVRTLPHRLTDGAGELVLHDERYTGLEVVAGFATGVVHDVDGVVHPLVWTRREGGLRIVADALGHGPESIEAPGHAALLVRALAWLGAAG